MKTMVEIPDAQASAFEPYRDRLGELLLMGLGQVKSQEALMYLGKGVVSISRAAEIAGISRSEMIRLARLSGIEPDWSEKMLDEDLA